MRRAIIHIGLPRTGTTTLQRVLTSLRPELSQVGVFYPELTPKSASEPHLSHQHLGEALDGRRPSGERKELLTRLSSLLAKTDAEVVLLSYESLCLIPPSFGVPHMLAALFARHGFAMEVAATVKPQGELTNSTYTWRTQFLREHRTFRAFYNAECRSPMLDYGRLFSPWQAACNGNLKVIPLRDVRSDQPLITRIVRELGLEPVVAPLFSSTDLTLVENRSPGPVAVEVARRLRLGGAHLQLGRAKRDVTRFVENGAQARGLDRVSFKGLCPALREADMARWQQRNDRFAQSVWAESWSSRVAAESAVQVNEIAQLRAEPTLTAPVEDLLSEACLAFRIKLGPRSIVALRTMAGEAASGFHRSLRSLRARKSGSP